VQCRIGIAWLNESTRWHCPRSVTLLPVADMNIRLPFSLIWRKDNPSPLLQKFVAQVEAARLAKELSRGTPKSPPSIGTTIRASRS
jgi:DNA-binding transcriptional LysR family regulator